MDASRATSSGRVGGRRDALPVGTILSDYAIEMVLGAGGFGVVYRARHQDLRITVAIKEYMPNEIAIRVGHEVQPRAPECHEAFNEGLNRFVEEARRLVEFEDCPGVVVCRGFFRANGTAYLVMEYVLGQPLSEQLLEMAAGGDAFGEEALRELIVPLLEGMSQVHSAGVLHRDIKPSNILIRRKDGRPVLTDFGSAKQSIAEMTKSMAPYTEGYAAIEQVGEGRLGPWTDLYAIGAVMWRIVAAANSPRKPLIPVRVETRAHAVLTGKTDPMIPARELGKNKFSPHLLEIIDHCLSLDPADRPQTCQEVSKALCSIRVRNDESMSPADNRSESAPAKLVIEKVRPSSLTVLGLASACLIVILIAFLEHNEQSTFSLGSSREDVLRIQGEPLSVNDSSSTEWWKYGYSTVTFSIPDGLVTEWSNNGDLRVRMVPGPNVTDSLTLTRGSHRDDVLRLHGTPIAISLSTSEDNWLYYYGRSSVKVSVPDGLVTEWANEGNLRVRMVPGPNVTDSRTFTRGSHRDDVLRVQGTPSSILTFAEDRNDRYEEWTYGPSEVVISLPEGLVKRWYNAGNLLVRMVPGPNVTDSRTFARGSHRDDVLRVQGTPSSLEEAFDHERWWYGSSWVLISLRNRRVTDWFNSANLRVELDARRPPTSGRTFTLGSHADDVLRIQGRPSWVDHDDDDQIWTYGTSTVYTSQPSGQETMRGNKQARQVVGWVNTGNLLVRMDPGSNVTDSRTFTRGSHRDDVLRIQGTPQTIYPRYPFVDYGWGYGFEEPTRALSNGWVRPRSQVEISRASNRVTGWSDPRHLRIGVDSGRNGTDARTFTRGSHRDDVLQIQGTPSAFGRSGDYELWWYHSSWVLISESDGLVTEWQNNGGLRVMMDPGPNVTGTRTFARGSHQDDLLQIQGTPSTFYRSGDGEMWWYDSSWVYISLPDRLVKKWFNAGDLRVR